MNSRAVIAIRILVIVLTICAALFALGILSASKHVEWSDGNGNTYIGTIQNGRFAGAVRIEFADDSVYEGRLKNGQFDGEGTYKASGGWSYTGSFSEGLAEGYGTLVFADGRSVSGTFKYGQFAG